MHPSVPARAPCRGPGPARAGFTLVEVVYVLLIVGVLAALALPRIDVGRSASDAAALEIGSILLVAQRTAVMRQHDVRVQVDASEDALFVHLDADNDGVLDGSEEVVRRSMPERAAVGVASGDPLIGTTPVSFAPGDDGLPVLVYRRNGSASEEGAIHVTSRSGGAAEDDRAIRVERATGLSRCWSRRTGSWTEGC